MKILITGGTGSLGSALTPQLIEAGHQVRLLSRSARGNKPEYFQVDLTTCEGLETAVAGVDVIIHAASSPTKTQQVDVESTAQLLALSQRYAVAHFIYVSIVGIDRIPLPYYRFKLAAENLIKGAAVPWSILRATQFHSFIDLIIGAAMKLPIAPLPADFQVQPIAAEEVATRLAEAVADGAQGCLPEIGGPEVRLMRDLIGEWKQQCGYTRPVMKLPLWGKIAAGFRAGYNTIPGTPYGHITWGEWLKMQYAQQGQVTSKLGQVV